MSARWEWALFRVSTDNGCRWRYGSTWNSWGIHYRRFDRSYSVTHIPSGCFLTSFARLRHARRWCEAIDGMTDWSRSIVELQEQGPTLVPVMHLTALRITGQQPALRLIGGGLA